MNKMNYCAFYRLTPAYMIVLLMAEVSSRWLRNISIFEPENSNHISCANYWWRNILYINSLYPKNEMVNISILINNLQKYGIYYYISNIIQLQCMLWSWYMSNDTQFYVLAIILLLISAR